MEIQITDKVLIDLYTHKRSWYGDGISFPLIHVELLWTTSFIEIELKLFGGCIDITILRQ